MNKRRFTVALASTLWAASLPCAAGSNCAPVEVQAEVQVHAGELTLADLLAPNTCPLLRERAAQVSLGSAPRAGSVRGFDGQQIRRLLDRLEDGASGFTAGDDRIPERITVRRAGTTKSCAEIARLIATASSAQNTAAGASASKDGLDCTAAHGITEESALELASISWNASMQRWEYALRCARPENCVPFLVWTRARKTGAMPVQSFTGQRAETATPAGETGVVRLVKRGQTATLTWDQGGIRIVLPVTCLEAGGYGQFVLVRLPNASRTLRAEVTGAGELRASL